MFVEIIECGICFVEEGDHPTRGCSSPDWRVGEVCETCKYGETFCECEDVTRVAMLDNERVAQ